ncbi:MAG: hypothetical protein KDA92_07815 [Planctomycetales bacterium]|nr:hypothetical protein [Planctomycetales bacterium]
MTTDGHPRKDRPRKILGLLSLTLGSLVSPAVASALEPIAPVEPAHITLTGYHGGVEYGAYADTSCEPLFQGGNCDNYCLELWANYCSERPQRHVRSPRQAGCYNQLGLRLADRGHCAHEYCDASACGTGSCQSAGSAVGQSLPHSQPPAPQVAPPVAPQAPEKVEPDSSVAPSVHPSDPTPPTRSVVQPAQSIGQPLPPEPDDVEIPSNSIDIPSNPLPDTTTIPSAAPTPTLEDAPQSDFQPPVPLNVLPNDPPSPEIDHSVPLDTSWRPKAKNRQAKAKPPEPAVNSPFRSAAFRGSAGTTRLLRQLNGK